MSKVMVVLHTRCGCTREIEIALGAGVVAVWLGQGERRRMFRWEGSRHEGKRVYREVLELEEVT